MPLTVRGVVPAAPRQACLPLASARVGAVLRCGQDGDGRLIENACRRCDQSVALRGPMGWLPDRLPTAYSLALERGAGPSGFAVAWLERGASAGRSEIRHGPPWFSPTRRQRRGSWQQ